MTRPTRPPGPPYPDDEEPPEAGQPRFTPRQSGPQPPYEAPHEPPAYQQGTPPYGVPREQPTYQGTPPYGVPPLVPGDRAAPPGVRDNRTRILEPDADQVPPTGPQRAAETTSPNLARSSKVMALGTIASRGTGFLRTLVLVIALGQATLSSAYNNSNTLPNTVYYLMLGGIFTSVVVPMLVRAAKDDPDRGEGYARRIYSLGVVALLAITVLATLLAGPIVDLYGG